MEYHIVGLSLTVKFKFISTKDTVLWCNGAGMPDLAKQNKQTKKNALLTLNFGGENNESF